ncbi:GNAT family N-acetyltransferase [Engelhardtia mirabilis]|uniref:N-acetyltransferase domain-containing protein n=1 Tax=Engelhardtia mirabilis TaxID=2528011 RepID=A0A518BPX8_9BACT|nr:hypothetical protein Pla133_41290 [Planctomycetes bacterium Pla133]QDV03340.1 hypothetical protein Pla86_41280 [Planctomycetes bacterium Pla86]
MRNPVLSSLLLLAACAAPDIEGREPEPAAAATDSERGSGPWAKSFSPPLALDTERLHLEPLSPEHVELDFAALMGSREHLQRTLGWGDWPREDFTVAENRVDLERHWAEFEAREGYAYTVLSPDRSKCLGCIYLVALPVPADDVAALAYWVIEPELATDLDRHLLESLTAWFERDWPLRRVCLIESAANPRGRALARELGFGPDDGEFGAMTDAGGGDHLLVWTRGR